MCDRTASTIVVHALIWFCRIRIAMDGFTQMLSSDDIHSSECTSQYVSRQTTDLLANTQRRWLIPVVCLYRGCDAKHPFVFEGTACNLHPNRQSLG